MESAAARLLSHGLRWYRRGEMEEAIALFDAARVTAETLGEGRVEADAWTHLGRASSLSCEPKIAEHAFACAAETFARLSDREGERASVLRRAFMAYDAGDLARAEALLDGIGEGASDVARGIARGYRGNVARSRGAHALAREHYGAAVVALTQARAFLYAATFEMDLAVTDLLEARPPAALEALSRARSLAAGADADPMLEALITHYEILGLALNLEHLRAKDAIARFQAPASVAMSFLARTHACVALIERGDARRLLDEIGRVRIDAPTYQHARLTLRILRGALGNGSVDGEDVLRIYVDEHRARLGSDLDVTFPEGSAAWRILLSLAEHRQRDDGEALSLEQLIEAGWPGARLTPESARNRVHVALSSLRKQGFREVLLHHPDGYALSRSLSVIRIA